MKKLLTTILILAAAALSCAAQGKSSSAATQGKPASSAVQGKTTQAAAQGKAAPAAAQDKTLDKRDLVTREWNTDVATNAKFLDHETIFDSEGRKIQETEYTRLGKLWTKKFEYGTDGKASRELTYNDKGKLDSVQKFEYNEFGRKKTVYTYDARGKLVKIKNIEYSYREHAK